MNANSRMMKQCAEIGDIKQKDKSKTHLFAAILLSGELNLAHAAGANGLA